MVVEEDVEPADSSEQASLLAEMQALQSMLAQLQVERQTLSAALSERLQIECNRAKSVTRVLKQGKRSSEDEPQPGARKAPGSVAPAAEPVMYRSSDLGVHNGSELADAELENVVDERCGMSLEDDDLHHGPPTYRSCSNGALAADFDDAEYADGQWESTLCDGLTGEADAMSATMRGLLDPSLDPSQVDLGTLRALIAKLGALVDQGVALQEEELSAALSQLSQLSVLNV